MTNIEITAETTRERYFSEDSLEGFLRVGRGITLNRSLVNKKSGVTATLHEKVRKNKNDSDSNYQWQFSMGTKTRQGTEIRNTFDLESDGLPFMYIGSSPYPKHIRQRFIPTFDEDLYGIHDYINRENFIPFKEIAKFNPSTYVESITIGSLSGVITSIIFPHPIDESDRYNPKSTDYNGVIEPLDKRNYGTESMVTIRQFYYGVSGNMIGGDLDPLKKGNSVITDVIKNIKGEGFYSIDYFEDSQSTTFGNNSPPSMGLSSLNTHQRMDKPFDDCISYVGESYDFAYEIAGGNISDLIYGSDLMPPYSNKSEIGTRYVSSTAGFIYESTTLGNTTLGTDSIAFGGLKR